MDELGLLYLNGLPPVDELGSLYLRGNGKSFKLLTEIFPVHRVEDFVVPMAGTNAILPSLVAVDVEPDPVIEIASEPNGANACHLH
jgi:hypothetical protein